MLYRQRRGGHGQAHLSTSSFIPQQIRASAIAVFYGFGTLFAGVLGPTIFSNLLNRVNRGPIFWGFAAPVAAMLVAGFALAIWGFPAEGQSLEEIM